MKSQQIVISFTLSMMMMFSSVQGYSYKVQVITGTKSRSDTDDAVYIILHGTKGVSQKKRLNSARDDFEKGRTDNFQLDLGEDLGRIDKIVLSKTGSDGWFCTKVVVRDTRGSYTFIVNRMLDNDNGNVRSITVVNQYAMKSFTYHVDKMRPIGKRPEVLGEITVVNNCDSAYLHRCLPQSQEYSIAKTTESSKHFTHTAGVSVTVGTSVTVGVPDVASATASLSTTASYSHEWGKAETKSTTWTGTYPCVAPPASTTVCEFFVYKINIDVPFTIEWMNGKKTEGMYNAVDYLKGGNTINTTFHSRRR